MRWFTRDHHEDPDFDDWETLKANYWAYIESIRSGLPPDLQRLAEVDLHDAVLDIAEIDLRRHTAHVRFLAGNRAEFIDCYYADADFGDSNLRNLELAIEARIPQRDKSGAAIGWTPLVRVADWCLAELVRVLQTVSLEEAQALVDVLAQRDLPEVWNVAGVRKVLTPGLSYRDQALLLLYTDTDTAVAIEDLGVWVEHPRPRDLPRDVIEPLNADRLVHYDRETVPSALRKNVFGLTPDGTSRYPRQ